MSLDSNIQYFRQPESNAKQNHWKISIRLGNNSFRNGFKPKLMFNELRETGTILSAKLVTDLIPSLDSYDPGACYLGWEILLNSNAKKNVIANIFNSLDIASVSILPPKSHIAFYQDMLENLPMKDEVIGEMLYEIGALTTMELQQALNYQQQFGGLIGDILIKQGAVQQEVIDCAIEKQHQIRDDKQHELNVVQVDSEKFNKLVTLVGDLIIHVAKVSKLSSLHKDEDLNESTYEMALTLDDMRETTFCLNSVPISNVFQRIAKDISIESKSKIKFEIIGEQTEVDRAVIEQIVEPVKHLVRNAIEHGFDSSAEENVITLKAYQETGVVVIEVSDDGKGLEPENILHIAKQLGIVSQEQSLYKDEIYNLIFEPGFSTVKSTGNSSCRGKGLDVVRRNIESLRGSVMVNPSTGNGVKITIRLPLNLAIVEGVHLGIAHESFILPANMMLDSFKLSSKQVAELELNDFISINGSSLQVIKMNEYIDAGNVNNRTSDNTLVVVELEKTKIGLLVADVFEKIQVVVKPLSGAYHGIGGFAGFTILMNGELALILDIAGIVKSTIGRQSEKLTSELYV